VQVPLNEQLSDRPGWERGQLAERRRRDGFVPGSGLSRWRTSSGEGEVARLSPVPEGHPLGYLDAFAALVSGTYAAITGNYHPGLPLFQDGLRAAVVTESLLASAR
jgi:hypothetical protein